MDLNKLFETQEKLDEKIITEKGLQGQDLLDKKILALQVELGELANEWQLFKFWKEDNKPRDFEPNPDDVCEKCNGKPIFIENNQIAGQCDYCDGVGVHFYNPLLEEYVDCQHFILSIGNEDESYSDFDIIVIEKSENVVEQFSELFKCISDFDNDRNWMTYKGILSTFMGLGEMLGFTDEEIEQAYYDKNKINHERQESGY